MPNKNVTVLISGASVAGLSIANWLVRYGFTVTVVERAPHIRPGGQALDVRGPAIEVAKRQGILEKIRDHATNLKGISLLDSAGNEVFSSTERTLTGGKFDSPDVEILRDDLCDLLFQEIGSGTEYLFDDTIVTLAQDETGVDVGFSKSPSRRFDIVIGADGLHSTVRRIAFGPEKQFIKYLGGYLAVFETPNFLNLDRWQVYYPGKDGCGSALVLGMEKDGNTKAYIGFSSDEPIDYDYRDIDAQKHLIAGRVASVGWEMPTIVNHMWQATDFHFDSMSQIRMDGWSNGRVVLVGDAAYSLSPRTGQGTTVAMVGAYVLAGELSVHRNDLIAGINKYERKLRPYIDSNQNMSENITFGDSSAFDGGGDDMSEIYQETIPDFGEITQEISLDDYPS